MSRHSSNSRQWRSLVALKKREQPYCGRCGSTDDLTGDHIIPKSKGGTDTYENVRVLCRSCNSSRGTKTVVRTTWFNPNW